jgi:hypothetical protein
MSPTRIGSLSCCARNSVGLSNKFAKFCTVYYVIIAIITYHRATDILIINFRIKIKAAIIQHVKSMICLAISIVKY